MKTQDLQYKFFEHFNIVAAAWKTHACKKWVIILREQIM
jgi:hypothetical protein